MALLGATAGGGMILGGLAALIATLLGFVDIPRASVAAALAGLAVVGGVIPRLQRFLPERKCQVRASVAHTYSLTGAAARWGARLGIGVCSYLVTPGFYAMLATMVLVDTFISVAVGAVYGFTRAAIIITFAVVKAVREARGLAEPIPGGRLKESLRPLIAVTAVAVLVVSIAGS